MPTINDIAKSLGISKGTVSKALNHSDDISETLRKKVLETAVEMGYEKKRVRKGSVQKLCILIEHMEYQSPESFGYDIVMGFKKLAIPAGWEVDVVEIPFELQETLSYDVFMLQNEYKGAFILGLSLKDPWMEELPTARTPAVLYDNYIRENPEVSYVGINNEEGFDMAVRYLKSLGHTSIGYIGGDMQSHITRARYQAFFHAMKAHGLPVSKNMTGYSYFISECTQKHLPRLLKQQVTALICCHDQLANAVITQCKDFGYRVPEDISVIGFDDAPFSAYTTPPLTTIRQDRTSLGNCGYYAMISLLNHTPISTLLLRAQLICRNSTGPVRTGELPKPLLPEDFRAD